MKQCLPLASSDFFQSSDPDGPGVFVPRLTRQVFARRRQKLRIFDNRRDLAFDNAPPIDHVKESRQVSSRRKPKWLCLVANNIMHFEPFTDRLET